MEENEVVQEGEDSQLINNGDEDNHIEKCIVPQVVSKLIPTKDRNHTHNRVNKPKPEVGAQNLGLQNINKTDETTPITRKKK